MLGSSNSIACANIMLNSAVAESLKIYADRLEKAENFEDALHAMIRKTIKDHKHIISTEMVTMIHGSRKQRKREGFSTTVQHRIVCRTCWMKRMYRC